VIHHSGELIRRVPSVGNISPVGIRGNHRGHVARKILDVA
jgi:hypothetical protein